MMEQMPWPEFVGYVASGLVFLTFCMKTMIPLRLIAIGSNVAFIVYGFSAGLMPILVLHGVLLPLNAMRLAQIYRMTRAVKRAATEEISFEWLLPFAKEERRAAGEVLMRKGEIADRMYFILDGEAEVVEVGQTVGPGTLIGEVSLFAQDRRRTATIRCRTNVRLAYVTEAQVQALYYQNPKFAYYLIRLVTQRLVEQVRHLENGAARAETAPVRLEEAAD